MTACAEDRAEKLGLHYRTMTLCTGDMGFASQKTYDIEVWLPGQEHLSRDFVLLGLRRLSGAAHERALSRRTARHALCPHAQRLGIAVGRALIAVMENYQNADGSITVPEVLRPYMGGLDHGSRNRAAAPDAHSHHQRRRHPRPGLEALERIAAALSDDVWVVAPETDQSGVAHSLSLNDPLRLRKISPKSALP
jgi:hypothetical protein